MGIFKKVSKVERKVVYCLVKVKLGFILTEPVYYKINFEPGASIETIKEDVKQIALDEANRQYTVFQVEPYVSILSIVNRLVPEDEELRVAYMTTKGVMNKELKDVIVL